MKKGQLSDLSLVVMIATGITLTLLAIFFFGPLVELVLLVAVLFLIYRGMLKLRDRPILRKKRA